MKSFLRTAMLVLGAACASVPAITVKMGSIAPGDSPWDNALRQLSADWASVSGGAVTVKIFPGGIAGDEDDMIRKMKIGQLDAAGLSGMGLARIYTGVLAVQLPLLVRTDEELQFVLGKLKPRFEKAIEEKGFKVVIWNNAGWAHFFSKRPVVTPADLRAHKLFNFAGDADGIQAWKDAGFHPVPLSLNDLTTGLQSGMVDAYTMTPLSTVAYQWFGLTKNMCGMRWAPLIGGVVVSTRIWNQIKPDIRDKMMASARKAEALMQTSLNGADQQAIDVMKKYGLVVNPTNDKAEQEWKAATEKAFAQLAGRSFDVETYELVKQYLKEYRDANPR